MFSQTRFGLPEVVARQFTPKMAQVCCYHGVVEQKKDPRLERNFHLIAEFRDQVKFLGRVGGLSLDEVANAMGKAVKCGVSITFDDGYANNKLAAEILLDAGLPCVIFVSTNAVGKDKAIWTVELSLLILHGRAERIEIAGKSWPLLTREEREAAFQGIRYPMKAMPAQERRAWMDTVRAQFPTGELQRLLEEFPSFQMLDWAEIRQLSKSGVEIGSHGVDHEIHHAAQTSELRRRELTDSKREIEKQLGKSCQFFAFPNGNSCDQSAQELKESGYELAFTTHQDFIRADSSRFAMPRISPDGTLAKFKQQLKELR